MSDDLDAMLDNFDRPVSHAVPLEQAPEPEPAEPWHNEPASDGPKTYPVTITRVEAVKPEIVYQPTPPVKTRKTPDELNWRECWLRIGRLYMRGHMDAAQYLDLCNASNGWRASGLEHPPSELLEKVRLALWAFESVDEERESDRAGHTARNRRGNQRARRLD